MLKKKKNQQNKIFLNRSKVREGESADMLLESGRAAVV